MFETIPYQNSEKLLYLQPADYVTVLDVPCHLVSWTACMGMLTSCTLTGMMTTFFFFLGGGGGGGELG